MPIPSSSPGEQLPDESTGPWRVPLERKSGPSDRRRSVFGRWTSLLPWLLLAGFVLGSGADRVGSPPLSGETLTPSEPAATARGEDAARLRLVLWNIHSGVGLDGRENLDRIAQELKSVLDPASSGETSALIGLNEVRAGWTFPNLARQLGTRLQMPWLFAPAERQWGFDHFGNGIVGNAHVSRWQVIPLPNSKGKGFRNVVFLRTRASGRPLSVLHTHIDRNVDRFEQLNTMFNLFLAIEPPVVLMGDLNTSREDPRLSALLSQPGVIDLVEPHVRESRSHRIDWMIGRGLRSTKGGLVESEASDHPLVWVELAIEASNNDVR